MRSLFSDVTDFNFTLAAAFDGVVRWFLFILAPLFAATAKSTLDRTDIVASTRVTSAVRSSEVFCRRASRGRRRRRYLIQVEMRSSRHLRREIIKSVREAFATLHRL